MDVRTLKKDEVLPPRKTIGGSSSVKHFTGFKEVVQRIRDGAIDKAEILTINQKDLEAAGGKKDMPMWKIAGRVAERLKRELEHCYEAGMVKNHNFSIYTLDNQVFIKKIGDNELDGFLHSPRGQLAASAYNEKQKKEQRNTNKSRRKEKA